jgi:DNA-binding response OmpR family regulator
MAHKILAIDDHPETLSIIVATLKGNGYRVVSSRSPFKGLQLAETEKPDLLLVDMNMPDMNGLEVVRKVRAISHLSQIPIIMFTAESDAMRKMEGFQAGVDDYVIKPTDPTDLVERVERLLADTPDPDPENKLSESISGAYILTVHREDKEPDKVEEPQADGQLIALVGARGGVGTTTTAINLAYMLAAMGCDTTLADFDLQQGHVGLYLNQNQSDRQGINGLAGMATTHLNQILPRQMIA